MEKDEKVCMKDQMCFQSTNRTARVSALRVIGGYQLFSDMSDLLFHHPKVIGSLTLLSGDNVSD